MIAIRQKRPKWPASAPHGIYPLRPFLEDLIARLFAPKRTSIMTARTDDYDEIVRVVRLYIDASMKTISES